MTAARAGLLLVLLLSGGCDLLLGTLCDADADCDATSFCRARDGVCAAGPRCDTCEALGQACTVTDQGASCGKCLEGVADGDACRTAQSCADLACDAAGRARAEGTAATDAACGACLPERPILDGDACRAPADCAAAGCDADHRDCFPATATSDARCGDCAASFVEDGAACRPARVCADLDCGAAHRACTANPAGDAACGACLAGFPIPSGASCRVARACTDLDCAALRRECVAGDVDTDAGCGACVAPALAVGGQCRVQRAPLQVEIGRAHTCARLDDDSLACWGSGSQGVLGDGRTFTTGDEPDEMGNGLPQVPLGLGRHAVDVSLAEHHSCAVLDDATVKCWGENVDGRLGLGDAIIRGDGPGEMGDALPAVDLGPGAAALAVVVGDEHSCALLEGGRVKCWGTNDHGQLGQGDQVSRGASPADMGDALLPVALGAGRTATALALGRQHTCALLDDASVACWGAGGLEQLGDEDRLHDRGDAPGEMGDALPIMDLRGTPALAVTAGAYHTCVLLQGGQVRCVGEGSDGELGYGDPERHGGDPGDMLALPDVDLGPGRTALALQAGYSSTCAVLDDHSLKCWGESPGGLLGRGDLQSRGDGPGEMGAALLPIDLGTGRTVVRLAVGWESACAILDDTSLKCWGSNNNGRLGLGDDPDRGDAPGEMGDALPVVDLGDQ